MKNKYQRMNKEEKTELKTKYKNDKNGKEMILRLNRLFITGCIGIIFSAFLFYTAYSNNESLAEYLMASGLAVMSLVFIISSMVLKVRALNKFALKQK